MQLPSARTLLVVALLLAGLANVHALVLTVRANARFQETAFATVRARITGIRAALGQRVALGGTYDLDAALQHAQAEGEWESVEGFTLAGRLQAAVPAASTVNHWVTAGEMESLRAGAVLVGAEPSRSAHRIIAYALLAGPNEPVILRFTADAPELAEDAEDQQQAFLGHTATVLALLLVGGLLMAPRARAGEAAPPRALMAYEEAMERLRDHGEEQVVRHEAERRQMEDVLRDKEALARAGELTAGIAHEMRNGLGTILGYARLIEKGSPDAMASARSIREECETLETVIALFVDFVKRETLMLAAFDVERMLQRVSARESRRAGPPVTVAATDAGSVIADEGMLERAFENLVRNAREAAGPGGHVWVTAAREQDRVSITVADDGPGLGAKAPTVLRPFFSTKSGGLGLGLPIALKIVQLHDGDLTLGDRVPRGAAITVRLPVAGPDDDRTVTEGSIRPGPEAGGSKSVE